MTLGQSIWHCKFLGEDENGAMTYSAPVEYKIAFNYLTVKKAGGYLAVLQYGKDINTIWRMVALKSVFDGVFTEGDLMYVDGETPDLTDSDYYNGKGANAVVRSVLPELVSITIDLQKV